MSRGLICMHAWLRSTAGILLLVACESPIAPPADPGPQPPARFGTATVLAASRQWVVFSPRDSILARYDPQVQQLAIELQDNTYEAPHFYPRHLLWLRLCGVPHVGAYRFASLGDGVAGTWVEPDPVTRPRDSHNVRWSATLGIATDSLILEEVDFARQRVRGRFRFRAGSEGSPWAVLVIGQFWGRMVRGFLTGCP